MEKIITRTVEYTRLGEKLYLCHLFDGVDIDVKDSEENYVAMLEISGRKRYAVLVDARVNITITKEAMVHSARPDMHKNLIAQAIVINSLANRLLGNFKIKLQKNQSNTRLFNDYDKALSWLQEAVKKENSNTRMSLSK
jgi:hypothetical protein